MANYHIDVYGLQCLCGIFSHSTLTDGTVKLEPIFAASNSYLLLLKQTSANSVSVFEFSTDGLDKQSFNTLGKAVDYIYNKFCVSKRRAAAAATTDFVSQESSSGTDATAASKIDTQKLFGPS